MAISNVNTQQSEPVQEVTFITKPLVVETTFTKDKPTQTASTRRYVNVGSDNYEKLYVDYTNNCVMWAKAQTGIYRTMGLGGMRAVQGQEPKVGSIGVLYRHAVVIENISNNLVTFRESNYTKNWITRRVLPTSSFLGYIYW